MPPLVKVDVKLGSGLQFPVTALVCVESAALQMGPTVHGNTCNKNRSVRGSKKAFF